MRRLPASLTFAILAIVGVTSGSEAPATYPAAPWLEVREREIKEKPTSDFIRIDQFGYRPSAKKVAVIANPQIGYDADAGQHFAPSSGPDQYQLRRWSDDSVVYTGQVRAWRDGATDEMSGDQAWWFDFSTVTEVGSYYVYDVGLKVGSFKFDIREDVYADILRAATRMYYYNRCNYEKTAEFAGANWADGAAFGGPGQDTEARSVEDRDNPATAKDLSGGWWDAGDYNKYVTFTRTALHTLLEAYAENPTVFGDQNAIPESGNGVPDLLDEVKWELDWLRRMQLPGGDSLLKMGLLRGTDKDAGLPPSADRRPRYYYPQSSSAATITVAGVFAHAAIIYQKVPALEPYAGDLLDRAVRAFAHYRSHPQNDKIDTKVIQAGGADVPLPMQAKIAVQAAVYLYAATTDPVYRAYVDENYRLLDEEMELWRPYESDLTSALLYYSTLPGATPAVAERIRNSKLSAARNPDFYGRSEADPYRAYVLKYFYHWGSLSPRAHQGSINLDMERLGLPPSETEAYRQRAEDLLHSFHGVNAFNKVFLTNMYAYGAEKPVDEIFHMWFRDGSDWDNVRTSAKGGPAPGFLTGGPNKNWKANRAADVAALTPPSNQPPAKAYREWNDIRGSWQVTEPGIYYQAAYIKLLSKFAAKADHPFQVP